MKLPTQAQAHVAFLYCTTHTSHCPVLYHAVTQNIVALLVARGLVTVATALARVGASVKLATKLAAYPWRPSCN